ncbi:cytochrome b/b6 domain-containing protein [uncultured Cohaesibacter sp.]|uniref:cytochrome b n=1 Tax=uncultured Cohaesibacter sp. TaxID=1002546 RepID=UPI0029300CF4|nr:cytochrome b/b6 domain-containing protein [uncultured Cohaesibacter sp.]
MPSSSPVKYSSTAVLLHWIGALMVIGLIVVGKLMEDMTGTEKMTVLSIHYYGGLATGVVFLLRLVFFFVHARPNDDPSWPTWQAKIAKLVHAILYLLPIIMVASGMIAMSVYGLGTYVSAGDFEGYQAASRVPPMLVHALTASLLIAAIALHVVAALYHQFVQKDHIFKRISMRKA